MREVFGENGRYGGEEEYSVWARGTTVLGCATTWSGANRAVGPPCPGVGGRWRSSCRTIAVEYSYAMVEAASAGRVPVPGGQWVSWHEPSPCGAEGAERMSGALLRTGWAGTPGTEGQDDDPA